MYYNEENEVPLVSQPYGKVETFSSSTNSKIWFWVILIIIIIILIVVIYKYHKDNTTVANTVTIATYPSNVG